jgi:hypothetical protein
MAVLLLPDNIYLSRHVCQPTLIPQKLITPKTNAPTPQNGRRCLSQDKLHLGSVRIVSSQTLLVAETRSPARPQLALALPPLKAASLQAMLCVVSLEYCFFPLAN